MFAFRSLSAVVRFHRKQAVFSGLVLLASILLISCSGLNFGGTPTGPTPTPTQPAQLPLAKLHWCTQPVMVFRDEGANTTTGTPGTVTPTPSATVTSSPTVVSSSPTAVSTPTTLTDWAQVEPLLGFTVYLPATLPNKACLISASGTIHDPIFGGSFTIGYLLPDHTSISLGEAPLRSQSPGFQCNPSNGATPQATSTDKSGATPTVATSPTATQVPVQLCSGVRDNTSIFFSASGNTQDLQTLFNALQSNVDWVPAS